jgi:hypothetical protein
VSVSLAGTPPNTLVAFVEAENLEDITDCAKSIARGAVASMLNDISELSYTDPLGAIKALRHLDDSMSFSMYDGLDWLGVAVMEQTMLHYTGSTRKPLRKFREKDIENHFYKNLNTYIPGATKTTTKTTGGHVPDGCILLEGETYPVEVKVEDFDKKAFEQLNWYMRMFGAKRGIAVAQKLTCVLPENIIFIRITGDDL